VRALLPIGMAAFSLVVTGVAVGSFGGEFGPTGAVYATGWVAFALIGAFLAWKRPNNAIGWLFAVIGIAAEIGLLAEGPNERGLHEAGVPDLAVAALSGMWFVSFALLPALLILFPDGRPSSPRWRAALWAIAITVPVGTLTSADDPARAAIGPAFVAAFGPSTGPELVGALQGLASVAMMVFVALGAVSIGIRVRRSHGQERQQLKWVAFGGGLLAATILLTFIAFFSPLRALDPDAAYPVAIFGGIPFIVALVSVPGSAAIAILRYRLYDIDVLINRTLVYAAVSAVLVATYAAAVLLLQATLRPFTGGSDLAVAVSTLVVVALFQPIRRRVQDVVDRRFYRSRYDAARTLDAFTARLRDDVELESVRADMLGVVAETVQPAHASVWLREAAR
jgi:hypothetical protein